MADNFIFCPVCQLPLKAINILPDVHVSQCMSIIDEDKSSIMPECPKGVHCLSTDIFHYRDFNHKLLAAYRSSADFVPPDTEILPTPKKKNTPKRCSRKQKTPLKCIMKSNNTTESDSEDDIFMQSKNPCRKLLFSESIESAEMKQDEITYSRNDNKLPLDEPGMSTNIVSFKTSKNDSDYDDILIPDYGSTCNKTILNITHNTIEHNSNEFSNRPTTENDFEDLISDANSVLKKKTINKNSNKSKKILDVSQTKVNNHTNLAQCSQTVTTQESSKKEFRGIKPNQVKRKLKTNQQTSVAENVPNERSSITRSNKKKNIPDTKQGNNATNISDEHLSESVSRKNTRNIKPNPKTSALDDSEDEVLCNKSSQARKKIKYTQQAEESERISNNNYLKSKTKQTRQKLEKLSVHKNSDNKLHRAVNDLGSSDLEQNRAMTPQMDSEDDFVGAACVKFKNGKKENKLASQSSSENCCVLRSSPRKQILELNKQKDLKTKCESESADKTPRLVIKKSSVNQNNNVQNNLDEDSCESQLFQAKKKQKVIDGDEIRSNEEKTGSSIQEVQKQMKTENVFSEAISDQVQETVSFDANEQENSVNKFGFESNQKKTRVAGNSSTKKKNDISNYNSSIMNSDFLSQRCRQNCSPINVDLNRGEKCLFTNTHSEGELTSQNYVSFTPNGVPQRNETVALNANINSRQERKSLFSDVLLKSAKCVVHKLELSDQTFKNDITPGSMADKDLLNNLERNRSNSPTNSLYSSCSNYNPSASISSESYALSENESEDELDEVINPCSFSKRRNLLISSSSDSDMPLASLIQNKVKKLNADVNTHSEAGRLLRSAKKTPSNIDRQLLSDSVMSTSSDNDSGKSTGSKNSSTNSIVQGKEIAGKILRIPKYPPSSGIITKTNLGSENCSCSDKDSDSGKSSFSKYSSFIPSEGDSSVNPSDSAFTAESSEKLVSSTSSTYLSSDDFSSDIKSYDPSYSTESENLELKEEYMKSKKNRISPQKYISYSHSQSENSSDISQKEKMLFNRTRTKPLIKAATSPLPNGNNCSSCENTAKKAWQSVLSKMRSSSFPSDLKIDSEDSLTVASSCSSSDTSRSSMSLPFKRCPFYKLIPDTPFAVDAFQYWNIPGVKMYFLSHYHSDHYIGLKKSFAKPIYCSKVTANLVRMQLRVDEKWLRVLELNEPQIICGVEVTALDANHCPGSMMFLFSLKNGQNYLHVGDFRGSKSMTKYPALQRITVAKLFLDTTYCSPQYCFPTQEEVIGKVIEIVKEQVKTKPRTLVVCGSYTIGKEKVFLGIAEALNWRVWARPNKQRVFACLNDTRISSRLSQDPRTANVHVLPMANIQIVPLQQHLQSCAGMFTHVLGFKPTGWELNSKSTDFKVTSRDNITVYGVPYSEHSSFIELRDFVQFLEPREIVPTVNVGSAASRSKMSKYFSEWLKPQSSNTNTKSQAKISSFFK